MSLRHVERAGKNAGHVERCIVTTHRLQCPNGMRERLKLAYTTINRVHVSDFDRGICQRCGYARQHPLVQVRVVLANRPQLASLKLNLDDPQLFTG